MALAAATAPDVTASGETNGIVTATGLVADKLDAAKSFDTDEFEAKSNA
jgi:hypothetical protein